MGVGCSKPARSRAWRDFSESFRSANVVTAILGMAADGGSSRGEGGV
jgi:hypothetical protein